MNHPSYSVKVFTDENVDHNFKTLDDKTSSTLWIL